MLANERLLFDTNFYRKVFSEQSIEILLLIPIIPRNIFKLHAKKVHTIWQIFHLWKKIKRKLSSSKESLHWTIWNFSVIQKKHTLTCPGFYRLIFQSLYHTSLISPRQEIEETQWQWNGSFRNFCKLFTNKLVA